MNPTTPEPTAEPTTPGPAPTGCCGHGGPRGSRLRSAACHILGAVALGLVLATGFAWLTKLLWNGLMPQLFALRPITYCQAFGLLILGRLLFGGFHHRHRGHGRRRHGWHGCGCGGRHSRKGRAAGDAAPAVPD